MHTYSGLFHKLAIEFSSNTGRPFGALKNYIVTFLVNFGGGGGRAFSQPLGFLIGINQTNIKIFKNLMLAVDGISQNLQNSL